MNKKQHFLSLFRCFRISLHCSKKWKSSTLCADHSGVSLGDRQQCIMILGLKDTWKASSLLGNCHRAGKRLPFVLIYLFKHFQSPLRKSRSRICVDFWVLIECVLSWESLPKFTSRWGAAHNSMLSRWNQNTLVPPRFTPLFLLFCLEAKVFPKFGLVNAIDR